MNLTWYKASNRLHFLLDGGIHTGIQVNLIPTTSGRGRSYEVRDHLRVAFKSRLLNQSKTWAVSHYQERKEPKA